MLPHGSSKVKLSTRSGYTRIPYRGKPADLCPDGPRYRALGNSMATTVVAWLGERIEQLTNTTP